MKRVISRQFGFSLLELMVVTVVLLVITGAVFGLVTVAQQRYKMESEFLDTFQTARVAMDQMARDIHSAGYPPLNSFLPAAAVANPLLVANSPFAWSPNYPANPCTVGGNCQSPTGFDLIVETDIDPQNNNGLEWVRYQLQGTTLMRGVVSKATGPGAGPDPVLQTTGALAPYVDNVMNNATAARMAAIRASYPTMFPGNVPVPVFTYAYEAGAANQPQFIRDVNITLIVLSPNNDPQTNQPRLVTLTGRARRVNPNQ